MNLLESIKLISLGTFATLTNKRSINELEKIREDFLNFSKELPKEYIWQTAWKNFEDSNKIIESLKRDLNNNSFRDYDNYLEILKYNALFVNIVGDYFI